MHRAGYWVLHSSAVEDVGHERCGWRFERGSAVRCGQRDLFSAFASGHRLRENREHGAAGYWVGSPGVFNAVRQSERTRHFRCLITTSTLKGSFCCKQHIHVYVKEEEWEVIYRPVIDGKESKKYSRSFCTDTSWRSKSRASLVQRRLSFFFCLFFIKSAMKLVVEPPTTVDLSLIVAVVIDADACPFAD